MVWSFIIYLDFTSYHTVTLLKYGKVLQDMARKMQQISLTKKILGIPIHWNSWSYKTMFQKTVPIRGQYKYIPKQVYNFILTHTSLACFGGNRTQVVSCSGQDRPPHQTTVSFQLLSTTPRFRRRLIDANCQICAVRGLQRFVGLECTRINNAMCNESSDNSNTCSHWAIACAGARNLYHILTPTNAMIWWTFVIKTKFSIVHR